MKHNLNEIKLNFKKNKINKNKLKYKVSLIFDI